MLVCGGEELRHLVCLNTGPGLLILIFQFMHKRFWLHLATTATSTIWILFCPLLSAGIDNFWPDLKIYSRLFRRLPKLRKCPDADTPLAPGTAPRTTRLRPLRPAAVRMKCAKLCNIGPLWWSESLAIITSHIPHVKMWIVRVSSADNNGESRQQCTNSRYLTVCVSPWS